MFGKFLISVVLACGCFTSQAFAATGTLYGDIQEIYICPPSAEVCIALYSSGVSGTVIIHGKTESGRRISRKIPKDGSLGLYKKALPPGKYRVKIKDIQSFTAGTTLPISNYEILEKRQRINIKAGRTSYFYFEIKILDSYLKF